MPIKNYEKKEYLFENVLNFMQNFFFKLQKVFAQSTKIP